MTTTYGIAVPLNHTFPYLPYISYTGVEVPERGIFTFTMAVTSIMLAANAEMRYLFVKLIFQEKNMNKKWERTNLAGLVLGFISSLCLLLIGCFQVDEMEHPHNSGVFLFFVIAIGYLWLQTVITWKLRHVAKKPQDGKIRLRIWIWQILISAASTIILILYCVSKGSINLQGKAKTGIIGDTLQGVFLVSATTEWLLLFSIMVFVLTFIPGFKRLKNIQIGVTFDEGERSEPHSFGEQEMDETTRHAE